MPTFFGLLLQLFLLLPVACGLQHQTGDRSSSVLGSAVEPTGSVIDGQSTAFLFEALQPLLGATTRFGEADNPGPESPLLTIGVSNPSGLRGKEAILLECGSGIHCVSETQLSQITQRSSSAALRSLGKQQNRHVRTCYGAPAPLRTGSAWAGSWTGVAQVTDFPSRTLQIPWPSGAWYTGRIMLAQHQVVDLPVLVATVYGFPSGPTYPDAKPRTESLLACLTKELVHGRSGFRVIAGDFNQDENALEQIQVWRSLGWVEIQTLAASRWGHLEVNTCKNATKRDMIYVSPEAAAFASAVQITQVFADHDTVVASFSVPDSAGYELRWPLPAELPWEDIDITGWRQAPFPPVQKSNNSTVWMQTFARTYESSLNGFVEGRPGRQVPSACRGRSKRTKPDCRTATSALVRASRPGEEVLCHDFISQELKRWFAQLRRLQSLCHALQANSQTPGALEYRASLWRAISSAKGFQHGFCAWWMRRPTQLQGSPPSIPLGLPGLDTASAIFQDFRENFRRFESWSIGKRAQVLDAKYQQSLELLYKDLHKPAAPQVDTLVIHREYAILAFEPETRQVHVDPPLDLRGSSTWQVDGHVLRLERVTDEVCTLSGECPLHEDSELLQAQTLADVSDIHDEFVSLWAPRWQKHASCSEADWRRVLAFAEAFLPRSPFNLPRISVAQWQRRIRKFSSRAARGPDGWARADLLNMPTAAVEQLLDMLHLIEAGKAAWPQQILVGFVLSLVKPNGCTDAQGYRPICLISMIYRAWAGLRAKQTLLALSNLVDPDSLGFLPNREATELWFILQSQIELSLQGQSPLAGFSSDIVKAFNNLPRFPLLRIASRIGFPPNLISPWRAFLSGFSRRFKVRDALSPGVSSSSGFPEGDPLSPIGMLLANMVFHAYMQALCPSVRALSYADNYSGMAPEAFSLARGINAMGACCDMLDLQLDSSKTFVWSTDPEQRKVLRAMKLNVVEHARELGGFLSFCAATRNAALVARIHALQPQWQALGRARSPLASKLAILPNKFWAFALHGIAGCPLASSHLSGLRASAVKAIRSHSAGSSALLRLSLVPSCLADPGFYQLKTTVVDVRRVLLKQPALLLDWKVFQDRYAGDGYQGPFSKLVVVLGQVGWSILEPPLLQDHEGLVHHLLSMPQALLIRLLEHAWLQYVASQHVHRKTMVDLDGLEPSLLHIDHSRLTPRESSRLAAIQSGAFLFPAQHRRFDLTVSGLCKECQVPDDVQHRICDCPLYAQARQRCQSVVEQWANLPVCLTHHLLVPRMPEMTAFRVALGSIADTTAEFWSSRTTLGRQNIFTDGTCTQPAMADCAIAAWSVVHAGTGDVIACGPLHGQLQTTPRAEMTAAIAALRWIISRRVTATLWMDAYHIASGINGLIQGGHVSAQAENGDLWQTLSALVEQLEPAQAQIQHVPSHLDPHQCTDEFEIWVSTWNQHADTVAAVANASRSLEFLQLLEGIGEKYDRQANVIRQLRSMFFAIADVQQTLRPEVEPVAPDVVEISLPLVDVQFRLSDLTPLGWRQLLDSTPSALPAGFLRSVAALLLEQDANHDQVCLVSTLELTVWIVGAGVAFPVQDPVSNSWVDPASIVYKEPHQTLAVQVRLVRKALRILVKLFHAESCWIGGINLTDLGVTMPFDGLGLGVDVGVFQACRQRIQDFCSRRPIRASRDLARPL